MARTITRVDRLSFGVKPAEAESAAPPARAVNAGGSGSDRCKTVQTEPDRPIRLAPPRKLPKEIQALSTARYGGVEPTTLGSGGPFAECRPLPVASDGLGNTRETVHDAVGLVGSFRGVSGADRCKTVQAIGRLRSLPGRANELLSVREIAARLGVSTATVYGLCERGELTHVRVSNAIRIPPANLAAFLDWKREGGK